MGDLLGRWRFASAGFAEADRPVEWSRAAGLDRPDRPEVGQSDAILPARIQRFLSSGDAGVLRNGDSGTRPDAAALLLLWSHHDLDC